MTGSRILSRTISRNLSPQPQRAPVEIRAHKLLDPATAAPARLAAHAPASLEPPADIALADRHDGRDFFRRARTERLAE